MKTNEAGMLLMQRRFGKYLKDLAPEVCLKPASVCVLTPGFWFLTSAFANEARMLLMLGNLEKYLEPLDAEASLNTASLGTPASDSWLLTPVLCERSRNVAHGKRVRKISRNSRLFGKESSQNLNNSKEQL
jgi:hypothetical protein